MNTTELSQPTVEPSQDASASSTNALILGCGFLGRRVATSLIGRGVPVHATTRTKNHAIELAKMGAKAMMVSVNQRLTLSALSHLQDGRELDVYYLIPPGKPVQGEAFQERVFQGIRNILASLRHANIRRAIMASTTAVYGHTQGQTVSADTMALPDNPRSQMLLDAEELWLTGGPSFHILRLAGLYGAGRVIGQEGILQGAPIVGDPQGLLNLIYVQDAADLLLQMMASTSLARIELGSDGLPIPRLTYYNHLATLLNKPPPRIMDATTAASEFGIMSLAFNLKQTRSKACDPAPTCQRTGWQPKITDFRQGLQLSLKNAPTK